MHTKQLLRFNIRNFIKGMLQEFYLNCHIKKLADNQMITSQNQF